MNLLEQFRRNGQDTRRLDSVQILISFNLAFFMFTIILGLDIASNIIFCFGGHFPQMSMLLHPRFTSLYTSIKSTMIKILCRRVLPAIRINSAIARGADLWNGPQQAENLGPQIPTRCPPRNCHWPDNNAICEVKLWSFRHGNFGGFPSRRSGSRHLCHGIPERKTKSKPVWSP